jgi:4-amino-4-deoxy-L-arabinose transferase-like glycosyltransferase
MIQATAMITSSFKPSARRELAVVLALVILGGVLRFWAIQTAGLDHFDEGVYALSGLGLSDASQPHRLYPDQALFSPPVFPGLVALAFLTSGAPTDTAAIAANALLGTLSILAIAWVGRAWFGPVAGIVAAALLALSQYHIALSRTALTDVAFTFVFLLALGCIALAFQSRLLGKAVIAGLAVGLAWNTKYHGWFALVIAGGALVPYGWQNRHTRAGLRQLVFVFLVVSGVAILCYLPWALFVQSQPGGYVALAQHQRTLIGGNWLRNLWVQVQQQYFWEGQLSRWSVLAALLAIWGLRGGIDVPNACYYWSPVLALLAVLLGSAGTALILCLAAIPFLIRSPANYSTWLLLSWVAIFGLMTPFYHPYSRLVLPFTVATFLGAGAFLAALFDLSSLRRVSLTWKPGWLAAALVLGGTFMTGRLPSGNPLQPSRSMALAADQMLTKIPAGRRVIVVGEPAVAFYLHLSNRPAFERTEDFTAISAIAEPVYLVTGVYTQRAPVLRDGLASLNTRLALLGRYSIVPKGIRVQDDFTPAAALRYEVAPDATFDLSLYLLRPYNATP